MLLAYGRMTKHAVQAAKLLNERGVRVGVIDCCSLRPLDMDCLKALFARGAKLITVEEGELIGGFGAEIARQCAEHGAPPPVAMLGTPNRFVAHGSGEQLLTECGLMPEQIAQRALEALGRAGEDAQNG